MAEPLQETSDIAHGGSDLGVDGLAIGRLVGEGDAQAPGLALDFFGKGPLRRRRIIDAGELGASSGIHHRGAVAHADADDVPAGKAAPAFAAIRTERVARAGRLHAEYAAGGRGNANGAAAV